MQFPSWREIIARLEGRLTHRRSRPRAHRRAQCNREEIQAPTPRSTKGSQRAITAARRRIGESCASSCPLSPERDGKAIAYLLNHWDGLTLFLDDGRVEMDTNPLENQIRPLTLTRKNSLLAGHDEGGRSWARIASLIATCKINSVEPYAWMKATLEAIATGHPQSRIDELLPWSFGRSP